MPRRVTSEIVIVSGSILHCTFRFMLSFEVLGEDVEFPYGDLPTWPCKPSQSLVRRNNRGKKSKPHPFWRWGLSSDSPTPAARMRQLILWACGRDSSYTSNIRTGEARVYMPGKQASVSQHRSNGLDRRTMVMHASLRKNSPGKGRGTPQHRRKRSLYRILRECTCEERRTRGPLYEWCTRRFGAFIYLLFSGPVLWRLYWGERLRA